jgi:predicted TIM-barrel fold metal-dependent hydrolase
MALAQTSKSADIRARLDHPVIDADGHTVECEPLFHDYLKQVAGAQLTERYKIWTQKAGLARWYHLSPQVRADRRAARPPWWGFPTKNTLDRATATLPKLLYERLETLGLDFTVLYPTQGLFFPHLEDEDMRRATCRALNVMHADLFREYADRITPVASIPLHTPQEGIEELEYAVRELGAKAIVIPGHVRRAIPAAVRLHPRVARYALWLDTYGLDSLYDYDAFWARCVELKVAPAAHSGGMGWGSRLSPTNYVYNHIGNFAAAGEALCKSLFLGGVTRRFPTLNFALLEGGVGWACNLYADLIGHWEKRNRRDIENYNPANLDREMMAELFERYGGPRFKAKWEQQDSDSPLPGDEQDPTMLDEFKACGIERAEDIRDLFVPNFYFGCEADDPMNAWAFNSSVNPFGARLRAIFSSDIGHWDVPDMTRVVEEAYELVENGIITAADFRDFVFTNPASLYVETNPDFFTGTVVEDAVRRLRDGGR